MNFIPIKSSYEDDDELTKEFCRHMNCHECDGTDINGEPNGYGCTPMEEWVELHANLIED